MKLIIIKHYDIFYNKRKILGKHLYWIRSNLCQMGKIKEGKQYIFRSFKYNLISLKSWTVLFLSLFGQNIFNNIIRIKNDIVIKYQNYIKNNEY